MTCHIALAQSGRLSQTKVFVGGPEVSPARKVLEDCPQIDYVSASRGREVMVPDF